MSDEPLKLDEAVSKAGVPNVLRVLGSLWLGAVIMVVWLVAMGAATVYEAAYGSERALEVFYGSRWFEAILWLLAVNTLASLAIRFPYRLSQLGFVIGHVSVLVILAGALMTDRLAVRGQISLVEGQTVDHFSSLDQEVLALVGPGDEPLTVRLDGDALARSGIDGMTAAPVATLQSPGLTAEILGFVADSQVREWVANDGDQPRAGFRIALEEGDESRSTWVLEGGPASVGPVDIGLLHAETSDALRMLVSPPRSQPSVDGSVRVTIGGETQDVSLEACLREAVALGESGYSIRVIHYFPHAMVTEAGEIDNVSDYKVNPFIEAEVTGPGGTQRHVAFARFPQFASMHGEASSHLADDQLHVTLETEYITPPEAPIELVVGPDDQVFVRFATADVLWTSSPLSENEPLETPWLGLRVRLLESFDRACWHREVSPVSDTSEGTSAGAPAVLVRLRLEGEIDREMWLRKFEAVPLMVRGQACRLVYSHEVIPLGFDLTLDQFRIDRYPGLRMERSYESHVSIVEPQTGRQRSRVISMNHPVSFGGYSLFQSSYKEGMGANMSILSVSRDPGQPVVFAGYGVLLLGLLVALYTRWRTHRRGGAA